FTPEELKALEEAGTHSAEITEFVPIEAIDPVYFDKAYYLAPDKGGAKPYALFTRALRESKRCALGRWAARGKQYIVMIRPVEDGLIMQQLLYAAEVRSIKDIEIPKTEVKDAELKLAEQLIEQQASDKFDPGAYTDEVRGRIEAAVQKKVEGQEITLAEAPEGGAQVIDLMEALRASLEKKAPARARAPQAETPTATRKPPKRAQAAEPAARRGAKK
ncbi:MAG: Ku protein, partial [Steroidobacteraceae bacterium]